MIRRFPFDLPIIVTMGKLSLSIHIKLGMQSQFGLLAQQRVVGRRRRPGKGEPAGPEDGQRDDDDA
jgi:hypothetical protein